MSSAVRTAHRARVAEREGATVGCIKIEDRRWCYEHIAPTGNRAEMLRIRNDLGIHTPPAMKIATRLKKLQQAAADEKRKHPGATVEIWATDEHRIGLKPITRGVWAPVGDRPIAIGHHRFEWLYVTGFVEPATGRTVWTILQPPHWRQPGTWPKTARSRSLGSSSKWIT